MKLQRESIKLDSSYRGKWLFMINDKNPEEIERVEDKLREMTTGYSVNTRDILWDEYCDGCPCYEDGYGSCFWILIEDVPAFKAAFKLAKAKK